jgi:hypothetical protein
MWMLCSGSGFDTARLSMIQVFCIASLNKECRIEIMVVADVIKRMNLDVNFHYLMMLDLDE